MFKKINKNDKKCPYFIGERYDDETSICIKSKCMAYNVNKKKCQYVLNGEVPTATRYNNVSLDCWNWE